MDVTSQTVEKRMKIAMFHELPSGGAKKVAIEYGKQLKKEYIVDLYYVGEYEDKKQEQCFSHVFFYKFIPTVWKGKNWKNRLYKDTLELFFLRELHKKIASIIDKQKYAAVIVHPSVYTQAPFLLQFLQTKKIYFCQEPLRMVYDPYLKNNHGKYPKKIYEILQKKIRTYIDRNNLVNADQILTNSVYTRHMIKQSYRKAATVCYLGVDTAFYKPQKVKKTIDLLFIGEKEAIDGYDLLLEVKTLLPKSTVLQIISRNEDTKKISDEELVTILNKSRILLCFSHNEPFGLTVLEAMACSIPVIGINEGGYKETILHKKTGYLVERDPNQIAATISQLLHNKGLQTSFGKKAREAVLAKWTWKQSARTFIYSLKKLL